MEKEKQIKNILDYYLLTTRLKDTIRSGWKRWSVSKERLESVAEHIFGTCMLCCAIYSECKPNIDLGKTILTLALHETEEILIGDITPFDSKEKLQIKADGKKAVMEIFKPLNECENFYKLIDDFDNLKTPEAIFARKCDKLECDLQAKIYDEKGYMNLSEAGNIINSQIIQDYMAKGINKISTFFILNDRKHFNEDDIFLEISKYIENNSLC
ncbi:MAG: HD domain-containing protein [Clostridia bacterium]|nr:HD domain-containing protein [Clostridia bacterium]